MQLAILLHAPFTTTPSYNFFSIVLSLKAFKTKTLLVKMSSLSIHASIQCPFTKTSLWHCIIISFFIMLEYNCCR